MCDYTKIKNLKVKNGKIQNLRACDINAKTVTGVTGTFENLTVNNLNATTLNGVDVSCLNASQNIAGVITPVTYVNGVPQQPANPGNFNQQVLDELWQLNQLAVSVTNLDAAYGRLRNLILNNFYNCTVCPEPQLEACNCPIPTYAVFTGNITGNQLTVTAIQNTSYTSCPPAFGTIQIGQRIYGQTTQFLASTIVSQVSGVPGGTGVYTIQNNFDDYSTNVPAQTMLSISDLGIEECAAVPLRIYGVETLSVGPLDCDQIMDAISYNINIANKTLDTKFAAVYVQVGWQAGATGAVNIQGLSIDTKQFDNSILSFGEQMNNNILLPTDLIGFISSFNRGTNVVNAVIQLAVYIEDGLEVFIPESATSSQVQARQVSQVTQSPNNYAVSFSRQNPCPALVDKGFVIQTYTQPVIGQPVSLVTAGIDFYQPNGEFFTGSFFVENGGWYIIFPGPNGVIFYNTGYQTAPSGSQIIVPPGPGLNATAQQPLAFTQGTFIQPQVGQNFTAIFRYGDDRCAFVPPAVVYLTSATASSVTLVGLYNLISIEKVQMEFNPPIYSVTLQNLGAEGTLPPGSTIPDNTFLSLLALIS